MRIAIIGSGVAGLVCAHRLRVHHEVTVFESEPRAGGHAHTHSIECNTRSITIDTGFIVFNERNYPILTSLLAELGVASRASDMSFGVSDDASGVEWCSTNLSTIFAQPINALRPSFLRMLVDIGRFNRRARVLLREPLDVSYSLADLLAEGGWSKAFIDYYLVPIGSSIWSADPTTFTAFPAASFARFFDNHGLLSLKERPKWRTVFGGSNRYVEAIATGLGDRLRLATPVELVRRDDAGVEVTTRAWGRERFDHVVLAVHSDDALSMLADPTSSEREILGAISYRENLCTLHDDESVLPRSIRARASWNWHHERDSSAPTLTYDLSRLQGLDTKSPILLTLNRPEGIDPSRIITTLSYRHPVYDAAAMRAQSRRNEISGHNRTSYAGAYWGYGFHEDGARSAMAVLEEVGAR